MNQTNPKVDFYFHKAGKWQEGLEHLREILLSSGLTEMLKWGVPCYTFQEKNLVLIHMFKEYFALLFIKGALMPDPEGILIQQTENTQAARQIRFISPGEVKMQKAVLKEYVENAKEIEKAGMKVAFKKPENFSLPEEFQNKLKAFPGLEKAFKELTPGRQRAYILHFSAAKLSQTRSARVEKCLPLILNGKGLND